MTVTIGRSNKQQRHLTHRTTRDVSHQATGRVRRPSVRVPHVDIYAEFDGVINPIGRLNSFGRYVPGIFEQQIKQNGLANADDFAIDRVIAGTGTNVATYRWSSELAANLAKLINSGQIHWHWVTGWWEWTSEIDQNIGFDHHCTTTRASINDRGNKITAIKKAIASAGHHRQTHDIVWIDSDFGPRDPAWGHLNAAIQKAGISFLKLTPNTSTGLQRSDWRRLLQFVRQSKHQPGLSFSK